MAFINKRFPDDISYGAISSPIFNTNVTITQSGYEQRIANWLDALHKFDVSHTVKTKDDIKSLIALYKQAAGRLHAFRFKDWTDFEITQDNCLINDDGVATQVFQCYKLYAYDLSFDVSTRKITRIVAGTFKLYKNGVLDTNYTINNDTGVVTLNTFNAQATYKFECEFDVPVRFSEDQVRVSIDDYNSYSLPCTLYEVRE